MDRPGRKTSGQARHMDPHRTRKVPTCTILEITHCCTVLESTHCCTKRIVQKVTNKIRNMHFGEANAHIAYLLVHVAHCGYDREGWRTDGTDGQEDTEEDK